MRDLIVVEGFNGEKYEAYTHFAAVDKMRLGSFGGTEADGVRGYMKQVAKRMVDWCGATIPIKSATEFLNALHKQGILKLTVKRVP